MKYSKYSKADEKLVKEFLESMYEKHQQVRGSGLAGGSGFTDFVHGFLTPWKEIGGLFNHVVPGLGSVITLGADAIDKAVPGSRYDTIQDALSGKKVQGSGLKRGRGRPKKV